MALGITANTRALLISLSQLAVSTTTVSGAIIRGWLPKSTWILYDARHHRYPINAVLQLQTAVSCAVFSFSTTIVNRNSASIVHEMVPLSRFLPSTYGSVYCTSTVLHQCYSQVATLRHSITIYWFTQDYSLHNERNLFNKHLIQSVCNLPKVLSTENSHQSTITVARYHAAQPFFCADGHSACSSSSSSTVSIQLGNCL